MSVIPHLGEGKVAGLLELELTKEGLRAILITKELCTTVHRHSKDTRLQGYPLARISACKDIRLQGYALEWIRACKDTRLQGYPLARIPACKDTRLQGYPLARIPACMDTRLHGYAFENRL